MHTGARYNINCSRVSTFNGGEIKRSNGVRYLRAQITAANKFCCSLGDAKHSFYKRFNCILAKFAKCFRKCDHTTVESKMFARVILRTGGMPSAH